MGQGVYVCAYVRMEREGEKREKREKEGAAVEKGDEDDDDSRVQGDDDEVSTHRISLCLNNHYNQDM